MTQTPVNIFDLLMGDLAGLTGGPVTGQPVAGGEAVGLFSDIINGYLTGNGQPGITGQSEAGEFLSESDLLTNGLNQSTAAVPENVAEFNRQLLSILPRQMGVIGANVKDAISNESIELEPGKYEILGAQIKDGKVSLELACKNNPGQTVRLTFPSETLTGIDGQQMNRVPLDGDFYRSQQLDNLLSRMNLKEIEIKPSGVEESLKFVQEPLKVTIVAEGTSGEMLIKGKLDRSRMRVSSADMNMPQVKSDQIGRAIPSGQFDSDYLQNQILNGNARGRTQIGAQMLTADNDPFEQFMKLDGDRNSGDNQKVLDSLYGYDIATTKGEEVGEKVSGRMVRFTLPDNLSTSLKANGRSVMIRIEPEHLGPARLSLSMTDDKLKARIVVESAPAKAALESSLDRLMNQLTEADIKVDQIEITINGDSAHNQFFGRQPHWRHRVSTKGSNLDSASPEQLDTTDTPPAARALGYAGPSGVNLLA